jgi:succinate-acetate transporter protein
MTQVLTQPTSPTTASTPGSAPSTAPAPSLAAQIADPAPLGLAGFALTTFMLSTFNAGLLPKSAEVAILGVALFYGGIAQLLAGMWEFVKGNTFGALAFSSYGAFWMSLWYLIVHAHLAKADAAQGVGIFLLAWTIFTLYMTVVTLRVSGLLFTLFSVLLVTFVFLTVGSFAASPTITHIGGFLGLVTAFVAWYASFAGVLNATAKRIVMPTWPR